MVLLIKKMISGYLYAERELIDPRTQDWFLVSNSWLVVGIVVFYNFLVLNWGPKFMKDRKPFELRNILIIYNIIQVVLSVYIFYEALFGAYLTGYSWLCQNVEYNDSPRAIRAARGVWLYYIVKVIDLLDTVFFVLRKKENQVSFLHVYHHSGMVFTGHFGAKYFPGGHGVFIGLVNTAVHAVMYSYYLLTVWDPNTKNSIWWKKYITQMQIVQFFMITVHLLLPFYFQCGYPTVVTFALLPQNLFMFVLFSDFYYKNYIKKPQKAKSEESTSVKADEKLKEEIRLQNNNNTKFTKVA